MQQSARSSVWDLMRSQPTPAEAALIQPACWAPVRTWQPAVKRLPPPR